MIYPIQDNCVGILGLSVTSAVMIQGKFSVEDDLLCFRNILSSMLVAKLAMQFAFFRFLNAIFGLVFLSLDERTKLNGYKHVLFG